MERDGWIGRERERKRERERNGRGSGRVRNAKRRKVRRGWKGVQEGNGRKGERGEQEFPLFPPNKAFPYFDTRIDIDSNETIKKGRKTMKVNINRCKKEKKDRKKKGKEFEKERNKGEGRRRKEKETKKKKLRVKRGPLTFGKWCTGGAAYERRPAKEKDRHVQWRGRKDVEALL